MDPAHTEQDLSITSHYQSYHSLTAAPKAFTGKYDGILNPYMHSDPMR